MSEITTEIKTVTPAEATEMLAHNTQNRQVLRGQVVRMVAQMKSGNWKFDGAPIRFAADGTLLDGQHRLSAVVESELPQQFVIIRGLERDSQTVMDTGRKRSLSDMLSMRGDANPGPLATFTSIAYKWDNGLRGSALFRGNSTNVDRAEVYAPSIQTLLNWIDEHPDVHSIIRPMISLARTLGVAPSLIYTSWWALYSVDYDDAEHFFNLLRNGAGLEQGNPILTLRNRLIEIGRETADRGKSTAPEHALALVFKAWNAYRDGRDLNRLYFKPGGYNPEPFPEPH